MNFEKKTTLLYLSLSMLHQFSLRMLYGSSNYNAQFAYFATQKLTTFWSLDIIIVAHQIFKQLSSLCEKLKEKNDVPHIEYKRQSISQMFNSPKTACDCCDHVATTCAADHDLNRQNFCLHFSPFLACMTIFVNILICKRSILWITQTNYLLYNIFY